MTEQADKGIRFALTQNESKFVLELMRKNMDRVWRNPECRDFLQKASVLSKEGKSKDEIASELSEEYR